MGEVYRARDTRLGHDVAIKVLPAALALDVDRRVRFEREARVVASLNHPHICARVTELKLIVNWLDEVKRLAPPSK
jgi:serine/threonine protein kinase